MLRYYLDEHLPNALAIQLRLRGIDVLTTLEAGNAGSKFPDESQLAFAARLGRVLVTEDQDFTQSHLRLADHAGIVYFSVKLSLGAAVEYLELLALTTESEEMQNQFVYGKW